MGRLPFEADIVMVCALPCGGQFKYHVLRRSTQHIKRRHFFIREKVEDHEICVPFVRSADNMADFFTKPLPAKAFFRLRDAIMNVPA